MFTYCLQSNDQVFVPSSFCPPRRCWIMSELQIPHTFSSHSPITWAWRYVIARWPGSIFDSIPSIGKGWRNSNAHREEFWNNSFKMLPISMKFCHVCEMTFNYTNFQVINQKQIYRKAYSKQEQVSRKSEIPLLIKVLSIYFSAPSHPLSPMWYDLHKSKRNTELAPGEF